MDQIRSADGTWIAYERIGEGPAITVVDGAFSHRSSGPDRDLANLLARQFTVVIYDRRGRGESEDTAPYGVEREIQDLAAVVGVETGSTRVVGYSAGPAEFFARS